MDESAPFTRSALLSRDKQYLLLSEIAKAPALNEAFRVSLKLYYNTTLGGWYVFKTVSFLGSDLIEDLDHMPVHKHPWFEDGCLYLKEAPSLLLGPDFKRFQVIGPDGARKLKHEFHVGFAMERNVHGEHVAQGTASIFESLSIE